MSVFSTRLGLAFLMAALCLGGRTAHAQAAPVPYWTAGGPLGFGSSLTAGQSADAYGNFAGFDGGDTGGGGFSYMRYNFPNGWFVGGERGGMGLSGINQKAAFGNFGSALGIAMKPSDRGITWNCTLLAAFLGYRGHWTEGTRMRKIIAIAR